MYLQVDELSTALQMLKKRSSNLRGKWEAACFVAQLPPQKKNNVHRKKPNTLLSLQTFTMEWSSYGHALNLCSPPQ